MVEGRDGAADGLAELGEGELAIAEVSDVFLPEGFVGIVLARIIRTTRGMMSCDGTPFLSLMNYLSQEPGDRRIESSRTTRCPPRLQHHTERPEQTERGCLVAPRLWFDSSGCLRPPPCTQPSISMATIAWTPASDRDPSPTSFPTSMFTGNPTDYAIRLDF